MRHAASTETMALVGCSFAVQLGSGVVALFARCMLATRCLPTGREETKREITDWSVLVSRDALKMVLVSTPAKGQGRLPTPNPTIW